MSDFLNGVTEIGRTLLKCGWHPFHGLDLSLDENEGGT